MSEEHVWGQRTGQVWRLLCNGCCLTTHTHTHTELLMHARPPHPRLDTTESKCFNEQGNKWKESHSLWELALTWCFYRLTDGLMFGGVMGSLLPCRKATKLVTQPGAGQGMQFCRDEWASNNKQTVIHHKKNVLVELQLCIRGLILRCVINFWTYFWLYFILYVSLCLLFWPFYIYYTVIYLYWTLHKTYKCKLYLKFPVLLKMILKMSCTEL